MSSLSVHYAAAAKARAQRLNFSDSAVWRYPAAVPSKGVLLLIHGFRGNHHGLEAIAGALPEHEIFIPDLPGFGASTALGISTLDAYANWLQSILEQMPTETHLVSHSFGTQVAVAAIGKGVKPASLTLINPIIRRTFEQKDLGSAMVKKFYAIADAMESDKAKQFLASKRVTRAMSVKLVKTKSRDLREWIHKQHNEHFSDFHSAAVAIETFEAASANMIQDSSALISVPTLMIGGARDELAPKSEQRKLAAELGAQLDKFRFVMLDEVGHLIHYEKPEVAASEIEGFLGDHF